MSDLIVFTKYEFDNLPLDGNGFVYIASFDNITKVGYSASPKTRINTLQIIKKRRFEHIYVSQPHGGALDSEKQIKNILLDFKIKGEWFLLDADSVISKSKDVVALQSRAIKTNKQGQIIERRSIGLDEYTAKKMQDKIDEANEQRKELDRKPIRVCDFMAEAVDRVTVAQLVRV